MYFQPSLIFVLKAGSLWGTHLGAYLRDPHYVGRHAGKFLMSMKKDSKDKHSSFLYPTLSNQAKVIIAWAFGYYSKKIKVIQFMIGLLVSTFVSLVYLHPSL
jgi:hypothetical protein